MRRDHARSLLEIAHDYAGAKAAEILAYCREQKSVFDGICDRAVTHARQILSAR